MRTNFVTPFCFLTSGEFMLIYRRERWSRPGS